MLQNIFHSGIIVESHPKYLYCWNAGLHFLLHQQIDPKLVSLTAITK